MRGSTRTRRATSQGSPCGTRPWHSCSPSYPFGRPERPSPARELGKFVSSGRPRSVRSVRLEVPAQPVEDDLEPLDPVERAARPRELVALGREADELHLALHSPEASEEVLALADGTAQ